MKKNNNQGGMFVNVALAFVVIVTIFAVIMVKCMPGNQRNDNTAVSTANTNKSSSAGKRVTRTSRKSSERKAAAESTVNLNAGSEPNFFAAPPDMMMGGPVMMGPEMGPPGMNPPGMGPNMRPLDFGGPMPGGMGGFGGPMGPMM